MYCILTLLAIAERSDALTPAVNSAAHPIQNSALLLIPLSRPGLCMEEPPCYR
jgi:hypothetical protein